VEAVDEVPCSGGVIYDTSVQLSISGIAVQTPDTGKHFLIKSNIIELRTGNTTVPPLDSSRLQVRLAWPDPPAPDPTVLRNNLSLQVARPVGNSTVPLASGTKTFSILTSNTATPPANNGYSTYIGDYVFRISATSLIQSGADMPYRFVVRFPDGVTQIFEGVLNGLTVGGTPEEVLKVTKSVDGVTGKVTYTVTDL